MTETSGDLGPVGEPAGEQQTGEPGLRNKATHALLWSLGSRVVLRLGSLVMGIIMARLLVPEDFGVYAVALLVTNILIGLNDLGLLLGVVRYPGDPRVAARTALTMAGGFSVLLYFVCFAGAPAFASFMNSPESTGVLRLICLTLVIDGLATPSQGLLVRGFRADLMAKAEFAAFPVGFISTVGLAVMGAGAWSFAVGAVLANVVTASFLVRFARWRPVPGWDRPASRWMLAYGTPLALTSLVEYSLMNADYIVVGRILGTVALGFYLLAYNISSWPVSIVSEAVRQVSIVGFANLQHDRVALREGFRKTFRLLVLLSTPLVLCLALLAEPVVAILYGQKWAESATVLPFLALLGGLRVAIGYCFDLLLGVGKSKLTLALKVSWCLALVPALIIGAESGGLRGVAIAQVLVAGLMALPLFLWAARGCGIELAAVGTDMVRPMLGAGSAVGVALLVEWTVDGDWAQLLIVAPAVVLTYAAVAVPRAELQGLLMRVRARRGGPGTGNSLPADSAASREV